MSIFETVKKYTSVDLPRDGRHDDSVSIAPMDVLFQGIVKAAEDVEARELDIRKTLRERDDLTLKLMSAVIAKPGEQFMSVAAWETVDKLPIQVVEWRNAIKLLQVLSFMYKRIEQVL